MALEDQNDTLSTDDAAAMLADIEAEDVSEDSAEDAPEMEHVEIADADDPDAEADSDEPEEAHDSEDEEEGDDEPETPAIEAPSFLDQEGKDKFAQLPPEAQELFREVEQQRQVGVNRKLREASELQKAAQAKAQAFDQRLGQMQGFVAENQRALAQYQNIDWVREFELAASNPDSIAVVQQHKAYYDQLVEDNKKAKAIMNDAEQQELQKSLERLDLELPQIDPSLADPAKRVEAFQEVTSWAVKEGVIEQDDVPYITAKQYALARDAMLYRKAKANAASPKAKLDAKTKSRAVKPGATGSATSLKTSRKKQLGKKRRLSNAEAAELLADL